MFADVSKWLGVEIILRETFKREREREELESLHRSVQVKYSCLGYFCGLLGFCIICYCIIYFGTKILKI